VCLYNDMICILNHDLTLLDLSAAFDTVDQSTFMAVLERRFGISDGALAWIADYLHGRSQVVCVSNSDSGDMSLRYGIPQGSVLGPRFFIQY